MIITAIKTMLLFSMIVSCAGQTGLSNPGNQGSGAQAVEETGETVAELDKKIFIIYQDSKDNFWFGSDGQGVYTYDGKIMKHYTTRDGLSNDTIREIQEDRSGNIYFTTHNGITKYNGSGFTRLAVSKADHSQWKLQAGDLWFKGEPGKNGPYRYDGKTLYHLEFPKHYMEDDYKRRFPNLPFVYSPYEVYDIYKDRKGNVWFGTGSFGICRYDGKSLDWMYEEHLTVTERGGSFGIRSILEDSKGKFWFCNTRYRYSIHPHNSSAKSNRMISYKRERGIGNIKSMDGDLIYFLSIVEDSNKNLWMVTYAQGVWRYDPASGKTTRYAVKDGSKDITLFSIYKDNHGCLWLGTHEAGAYRFNGSSFEKFRFEI